jgi:hypothetical protein
MPFVRDRTANNMQTRSTTREQGRKKGRRNWRGQLVLIADDQRCFARCECESSASIGRDQMSRNEPRPNLCCSGAAGFTLGTGLPAKVRVLQERNLIVDGIQEFAGTRLDRIALARYLLGLCCSAVIAG